MRYRGIWIHIGFLAAAFLAFAFAPTWVAWWVMALCFIGCASGLTTFFVDWYRHIKQFQRERDQFNQALRDRS